MKIDLTTINKEQFNVKEHTVAGESVYLVNPNDMGCEWDNDNLIFRSSVWNSDGELVSASFKKFFNYGEKPSLTYTPVDFTANGGCELLEKLDGSTLIVSKYKGEVIIRTRGTINARIHENTASDIDFLINKYPRAFFSDTKVDTVDFSVIYEWTTPNNRIVINYGDTPEIYLIGIVYHKDYSLASQSALDLVASELGVKRPIRYNFDTIEEMLKAVEAFKGVEGICCYCNHGQDIRKIKSAEYLLKHCMKSELDSIDKVLDVYIAQNTPSYDVFYKYVCDNLDYEIAEQCKNHIFTLSSIKDIIDIKIQSYKVFCKDVAGISRKEQAEMVFKTFEKEYSGFVFAILDGRDLSAVQLKKLYSLLLK